MNKEQAQILSSQISVMTKMSLGMRDCTYGKNGFTFKCNRSRYVTINLNEMDLYDIKYFRIKRSDYSNIILKEENNIYCDMLNSILYNMTQN